MATCDGQFEPKATAPPNWVITPENLYSGRLLDIFAGVYAAKELASQTQSGTQNQEYSTRKNQWLDLLGKLKLPPQQNTRIIDLGLTPDLCHQGRPPEPSIPSLTPEALANGSVGNAIAELLKQQLFDQWCECKPRDRRPETCPCQKYLVTFTTQRLVVSPTPLNTGTVGMSGKLGSLESRVIQYSGYSSVQKGILQNIDCPPGNPGDFYVLAEISSSEAQYWEVNVTSVVLNPNYPVIDCRPSPPPPPPPPYNPGLPPGYYINLPPELPAPSPEPRPEPQFFIPFRVPFGTPTFPPDPVTCDYMYWDKNYVASMQFYSDIPPPSGVVVYGTVDTVDFDISFDPVQALDDKTLRSWRKRTQPIAVDTTFINAAQVYLMIDGVVLDDGVQMNVPKIRLSVPFEYRSRQKSIKIMAKGIQTTFTVADSGTRWISKKFPTSP